MPKDLPLLRRNFKRSKCAAMYNGAQTYLAIEERRRRLPDYLTEILCSRRARVGLTPVGTERHNYLTKVIAFPTKPSGTPCALQSRSLNPLDVIFHASHEVYPKQDLL